MPVTNITCENDVFSICLVLQGVFEVRFELHTGNRVDFQVGDTRS